MEEDNKYFEKIEAYLRGELSVEEARAFRTEVAGDPELKSMLLRHRLAERAIELAQDDFLKDKMQMIREKYGPISAPETKRVSLRMWMANAAAILILIIAGIGGFAYLNYSGNALIRTYYEQAASPTIAGGDAQTEQWFAQGMYLYYQQKDYAAALQAFALVEPNSDQYKAAQYFIAHCQLRIRQYDEALIRFDQMLQTGDIPVFAEKEEIEWNRVLCYLGKGEDENAQQFLQTIIGADTYSPEMKEQARSLNRKINSFWRNLTF